MRTEPARPLIRGDQRCPVCGLPPERTDARDKGNGVHAATLLCAQAHLWQIQWPVLQVAG